MPTSSLRALLETGVRSEQDVAEYILRHIDLRTSTGRCSLAQNGWLMNHREAQLELSIRCPPDPEWLEVRYDAIFGVDRRHRTFLDLTTGSTEHTDVFSHRKRQARYPVEEARWWKPLGAFIIEGVWHIFIGYDHILFLLTLLLAAARLQPPREAFRRVVRIVTAFTVAHSITLSLASLGWMRLPASLVESVIALSMVVAALENLRPMVRDHVWLMTFAFGLVHGFGFASVLQDVGLPAGRLAVALFGFNVGVELGQLAIVMLVFPALALLGRMPIYPRYIVPIASVGIMLVGSYWVWERAVLPWMPPGPVPSEGAIASAPLRWHTPNRGHWWSLPVAHRLAELETKLANGGHLSPPDDRAAYETHALAQSLERLGAPVSANAASTTVSPEDTEYREWAAVLLARNGQLNAAAALLAPEVAASDASDPNQPGKAWRLFHLAELLRETGQQHRYAQAVEALVRCLKAPAHTQVAVAASDIWTQAEDLSSSLKLRIAALTLHQTHGTPMERAQDLEAIGELHVRLGHLPEAIRAFRSALKLDHRSTDIPGRLHRRLGPLAELVGSQSEASFHYRRALEHYESLDDDRAVRAIRRSLVRILRHNEELEAARDHMTKLVALDEQLQDRNALGRDLAELANLNVMLRDTHNAGALYERAMRYTEDITDREKVADLWANLGALRSRTGHGEAARALFRQSLPIYEELGKTQKAERIHGYLARLQKIETKAHP